MAALPDIPFVGITLTLPQEFRSILTENRHLLHALPAMGAEAIMQWAKARYGVKLIVIVVQQTFGGLLTFVPHLHVMVSAGGLKESTNRWIRRIRFEKLELMRAWRYGVIALFAEARKKNVLKSLSSAEELLSLCRIQYQREWNIFISRAGSKTFRLKHDGRYVRRPPIAQHRIVNIGDGALEYIAKDTRKQRLIVQHYTFKEFVDVLIRHAPDHGHHAMRYFGLLAPRCKALVWAGIFVLLNQRQRSHPKPLRWRDLSLRTFGIDPLHDSRGCSMHFVGRQPPVVTALGSTSR